MIELKTPKEIEAMKPAGRFVGGILRDLKEFTKVGTNLLEIDEFVHKRIVDRKGASSCYVDYAPDFGTGPFAHYICTSVNDAVLHGVPYDYNLKDGDLVSLDLAINVDGWVADSAISFCVGTQHPDDLRLIKCTEEALAAGIEAAQPGNRLGDVSCAVGDVAREYGYPINLEFGGHGVGRIMASWLQAAPGPGHRYRTVVPQDHRRDLPGSEGRLDAEERGRLPWRAQRAHHRHHRERSGDPHRPRLVRALTCPSGVVRSHARPLRCSGHRTGPETMRERSLLRRWTHAETRMPYS